MVIEYNCDPKIEINLLHCLQNTNKMTKNKREHDKCPLLMTIIVFLLYAYKFNLKDKG